MEVNERGSPSSTTMSTPRRPSRPRLRHTVSILASMTCSAPEARGVQEWGLRGSVAGHAEEVGFAIAAVGTASMFRPRGVRSAGAGSR